MPFHDNVYYPFEQNVTEVAVMLNAPWMSQPFLSPSRMPSSTHGTFFKFRTRHESVDWRRIGAINVDRVANELDFQTLQDNIMGITFCNVENEKCPHCHNNLDPVLIKLIRLTQFTIEYLLHSQEYLTSNLQTLEEKNRAAMNATEQVQVKINKQTTEIKSLKDECKLRKKIIATQQMMITASTGPYHKCQHCEKSFVNFSYLESHVKRRHIEDVSLVGKQKQSPQQYENLHYEINCLKEELQFTKKQLETEKTTHLEKLSQLQESENRKTMELEVLKKFDQWKAEERETFEEEMRKVKEMFMKELKELTDKNSTLENELTEMKKQSQHRRSGLGTLEESPPNGIGQTKCDTENIKDLLEKQEEKWRNHIQELKQEYEREKNQTTQLLRQEHDREKDRVLKLLQQDFDREKRQIVYQLQQERDREKSEKNQIKELMTKPPPTVKIYSEPSSGQSLHSVERKHSATASSTRDLESEEQSTIKYHVRNEVKNDHSSRKAIRKIIEQGLEEKMELLGFKVGVRGIPSDKFQKIMTARQNNRHVKEKTFPGIQKIYEKFTKYVTQKAEEQLSTSFKCASTNQLLTDAKSLTWGSTTSFSLPRQKKQKSSVVKSPQEESEPRYPVPIKSSTPKIKLVSSKDVSNPPRNGTPPFSSEDESESNDTPLSSYKHPYIKRNVGFVANDSESDGSLLEEVKPQPTYKSNGLFQAPPKPARATQVKELGQKLSGLIDLKAVGGGGDVPQAFVKKDPVMELKLTDLDDTELESSSLEDEPYEVPRSKKRQESTVHRKEVQTTSVKNTSGVTKLFKADVREADTSSTVVSSLVTVSDFSDNSDMY